MAGVMDRVWCILSMCKLLKITNLSNGIPGKFVINGICHTHTHTQRHIHKKNQFLSQMTNALHSRREME